MLVLSSYFHPKASATEHRNPWEILESQKLIKRIEHLQIDYLEK